jgi:hypothetical protein
MRRRPIVFLILVAVLVAASATVGEVSASGGSSSSLLWSVALYAAPAATDPQPITRLSGPLGGVGTRPADFQAVHTVTIGEDANTLYAAGVAWDTRIAQVVGKAVTEVMVVPVNGFWFMQHEGGTGWREFRALDAQGKVLYTVTPTP